MAVAWRQQHCILFSLRSWMPRYSLGSHRLSLSVTYAPSAFIPRNLAGTPRISCASPPPILPTYLAAKAAHHGKVFEDCGNYTPGQLVQDLWTSWHSTGQTTWH